MSVITNNLLLGEDGYNISRSVRLRSSASAYFNRTPAGAGTSNKTFTYSGWVKRGSLGSIQNLISSPNTGNSDSLRFSSADKLEYNWQDTAVGQVTTTQVFRDASAWYHIVFAMDTTQATASNRFKLYVNGVQVTAFDTASYPAQNTVVNNTAAVATKLGQYANSSAQSFDGYLTEVNFIDGQALTPSSFGETDLITGVWKPKKYAGTYGTNGFYLNFSDNSNNTAATIGKDSSGNGNNWTPNNISVTSGSTYDSMLDVPTMWADGGNGRGNYAVLNPLNIGAVNPAFSNGNLTADKVTSTSGYAHAVSSIAAPASGYWYAEFTVAAGTYNGPNNNGVGAISTAVPATSFNGGSSPLSNFSTGYLYWDGDRTTGSFRNNSVTGQSVAGFQVGDVLMVAIGNGGIWFGKNGTWLGTGSPNPATATSPAYTGLSGDYVFGVMTYDSTGVQYGYQYAANFGQRPFAYTPPTGFKALNTQNLPDSTIKKGNAYFDATTYTGNGSTQSIVNSGGMQPDLVWIKNRTDSATADHVVKDSVRGSFWLYTNTTDAEISSSQPVLAADGFSINSSANRINASGDAYVGWQWKESVSAGFDIVTFTNPSSGSSSFSHSLGVKPSMIIVKARSNTSNWTCTHKSLGTNMADKWINLESTAAVQTSSNIWGGEPTSSVFYCGTGIQVASATMVAYLFAEVTGFSRFGSYTGNGSADGPFVYLGFRPRFVMIKRTDSAANWYIYDPVRDAYNAVSKDIYPNLSNAESENYPTVTLDIVSNGFKLRRGGVDQNASGGTYIYAAFAENPFKNSLAR